MPARFVENCEVRRQSSRSGVRSQQLQPERVEGLHRHPVGARAQEGREAQEQLGRRFSGEGYGGDLSRRGGAGAQEARNPFDQGARLASAWARHDEQRPLAMGDGCLLFKVRIGGEFRRSFFACRTYRGLGLWFLGASDGRTDKAEGGLGEQAAALLCIEHAHDTVLAVIASLPSHLARAHAAHGLGKQRRSHAVQVFQRCIPQHAELGTDARHQLLAGAAHALTARAHAQHLAQDLGKRNQAGKRLGPRGPKTRGPVRQGRHPAEYAARQRLSATRTDPPAGRSLFRRHHHIALAVAVGVVLALLGEKLERAEKAWPAVAECVADREVGKIAGEQVGFAPQFFG